MANASGKVADNAADNTASVTVDVPAGARWHQITVYTVDSDGNYSADSAATADLDFMAPGADQFEPVRNAADDGDYSFDLTAAYRSKTLEMAATKIKATPSANLDSGLRLRLVVNYDGGVFI